jgi:hypothetical protein
MTTGERFVRVLRAVARYEVNLLRRHALPIALAALTGVLLGVATTGGL